MNITSKILAAALVAALITGCGYHGKHHMMRGGQAEIMKSIMSEVDTDGSESISQAEIDAFRAAKVRAADTSRDGNLTLNEFETVFSELIRPGMIKAFQRLDENDDGLITAAEMDERLGDIVARMDRNGDGELSRKDRRHHDDDH